MASARHENGETDGDLSGEIGWMLVDEYGDLIPSLVPLPRLGAKPDHNE